MHGQKAPVEITGSFAPSMGKKWLILTPKNNGEGRRNGTVVRGFLVHLRLMTSAM
jgi:hypothetical protein